MGGWEGERGERGEMVRGRSKSFGAVELIYLYCIACIRAIRIRRMRLSTARHLRSIHREAETVCMGEDPELDELHRHRIARSTHHRASLRYPCYVALLGTFGTDCGISYLSELRSQGGE